MKVVSPRGFLLPLREKVSAKPTDEGSHRLAGKGEGHPRWQPLLSSTPHPALRATFSRKGRRDTHGGFGRGEILTCS
jgi:hypothetical protein